MSVKLLLREFERIGDQSDAVPRLRDFVRKLAVNGNLSPTEPTEWSDCTLDDVGAWGSGGTPLKGNDDYYGGEIPWLVIGDLNDGLVTTAASTISELGLANSSAKMVEPGTVLIAMYGSIGKLGLAGIRCATNQAIAYCAVNPARVTAEFLMLALRSMRRDLLARGQGGTQPNISQTILKAWPISLPPLAEQHRIVAKVDELMTVCDQWEIAQKQRELQRDALRSVSLHRLVSTDDAADGTTNVRFFLDTSPLLVTKSEHVAAVRQTVLDLAVRGRLVPQDPADEPAALDGQIDLRVRKIGQDELPYKLPATWTWVRLGSIAQLINGDRSKQNYPNKMEYVASGVPWINTGHITPDGGLSRSAMHHISQAKFDSLRSGKTQEDDLVYCLRGAIGKTAIIERWSEGAVASSLVIVRIRTGVAHPRFVRAYLVGPTGRQLIKRFDNGSAQPNLAANSVRNYVVPLPPFEEQVRIVAKIDELMAVCDELEGALASALDKRARLLESLLHEALKEKSGPMALAEAASAPWASLVT